MVWKKNKDPEKGQDTGSGGQSWYGDSQDGYEGGQNWYGNTRDGYNGGQSYYGNSQDGYNKGGQSYYGSPQNGGQSYYGNAQDGYTEGQSYYGNPQNGGQSYYGNAQDGYNSGGQSYYGNAQDGYNNGERSNYGSPQDGYNNGGQSYYGNPQDGYNSGQSYYGNPQDGYSNDGQSYYGNPQDGYNNGGQNYYGSPQDGYNNGGQSYYGNPQDGRNGGQSYYGSPQDGYNNGGQSYYGSPQDGYDGNGSGGGDGYNGGPGFYGEPQENGMKKRKKKKKRSKVVFVLEILVLLILALGLAAFVWLNKMERVGLSDILINSGVSTTGYRNIALFGVDSRTGDLEGDSRTDTIIIASINNKTGDIKLVSVYRDTYLDNTDGTYRKATECYQYGGAEQAVNMLNKNFDLDITDFVTVDFNAVIEAVDLLGGIDVEITEEERTWLNAYLVETSEVTGYSYTEVAAAGTQHLTGIQAMAYCRIRYTTGWDYKRTERQRTVLYKIFEGAKAQGVTGLINMVNTMLPDISTSLSNTEILSLAASIGKYDIVESTGFPFNQTSVTISGASCVVSTNLVADVKELHELLFGDEDYTPSSTVQEISAYISSVSGV